MEESLFYKKLTDKKVQCYACNHKCLILPDNSGICGVRENISGKLYSLTYGLACAENIDPIEKKPFFHFLPGTNSLSVATVGCNFRCLNCQNWDISQGSKIAGKIDGFSLPQEKIVEDALKNNCRSISYTYTEPTIFVEYALETMKLAKKAGLKNAWVSNGYMTKDVLKTISPYLDAINVDLKSVNEKFYQKVCGAKLKPVLENLKMIKKLNIWLEITTLVIPIKNDTRCHPEPFASLEGRLREGSRINPRDCFIADAPHNDSSEEFGQIAKFIKDELGDETPWHISKFSPEISWKMQTYSPTPEKIIKEARDIGLKAGLKYVYTGNLWDNNGENTYCPKCKALNIKRIGFSIERLDKNGKCHKCGTDLNLVL